MVSRHQDPLFEVSLNFHSSSPNPIMGIWEGQHICVAENHPLGNRPSRDRAADTIINKQLKVGHWSVLEQAFVSFYCYNFPHSTMVQIRTHVGDGLAVLAQSGRYTGDRFVKVANQPFQSEDGSYPIEKVLFFSPVGLYQDRQGSRYYYSSEDRLVDMQDGYHACQIYTTKVTTKRPLELSREQLPYEFRQDFILSGTLRSIFHLLDVRSKADAQWQCQELSRLMMEAMHPWCPELVEWYQENRYGKAITSP